MIQLPMAIDEQKKEQKLIDKRLLELYDAMKEFGSNCVWHSDADRLFGRHDIVFA